VTTLLASDGLLFEWPEQGPGRIAFGDPAGDWLGEVDLAVAGSGRVRTSGTPLEGRDDLGEFRGIALAPEAHAPAFRASVRAYAGRPLVVFRLEAAEDLAGLASGSFEEPSIAWPRLRPERRRPGGLSAGATALGHQFTEFALPTWSDPSLAGFFLLPHRPAVLAPLWIVDGERCLMLAPLDGFHEQVIAVPRDGAAAERGVRCGWQGDMDEAPRGFATELALFAGASPRALAGEWAGELFRRFGTRRPSRYADPLLARLSYWTDNGASYWYRSEPGCDVAGTLERVATGLREQRIPVCAFQLDSWFYPHEKTRPFDAEGGGAVPPTGMLVWEPRGDALPDGIPALRRRLGDPPLVLHSRHFSSQSPYFAEHAAWVDGDRAHPKGPELFERLLASAQGWGAVTYEQDWLIESFLGVRGLRQAPGRARAWQRALDRAAAAQGLTLQWCMASPADFFETLGLERVTSIRTSGDYRYIAGSGALWTWFLVTNALARALGLLPFKDVFLSNPHGAGRDGDPHAEAEALLAALSAGPVGIGDRAGTSVREIAMRTCRQDGVLVKPDVPIAALDRCFAESPFLRPAPLIGETWSDHPAGRWSYVACFNAWRGAERIEFLVDPADLGAARPAGPAMRYDWRSGAFERLERGAGLALALDPLDWSFSVLCPLLPGGIALFGDPERYATAGDRRLSRIRAVEGGIAFDVLGAPGERVRIVGWSERPLAPLGADRFELARSADGRFDLGLDVGPACVTAVRLGRP
jgi:hypothetical protein